MSNRLDIINRRRDNTPHVQGLTSLDEPRQSQPNHHERGVVTDITSPPTPPQDHATIWAALRALSNGARPSDLALTGVLSSHHPNRMQEQVDLCWKHGTPPPLQELIDHHREGLMTDGEVAELLPLYPGQRVISK